MNLPPSWGNRAGRADRAACLEVSASEARRQALLAGGVLDAEINGASRGTTSRGLPHDVVVRLSRLEARFTYVIRADELLELHRTRLPRKLAGDFRTGKSPAMRPPPGTPGGYCRQEQLRRRRRASWDPQQAQEEYKRRGAAIMAYALRSNDLARQMRDYPYVPRAIHPPFPFTFLHIKKGLYLSNARPQRKRRSDSRQPEVPRRWARYWHPGFPSLSPADSPWADGLPENPNRGAGASKTAGLPEHWSQEMVIERHRLHARLAQHFLVCPRCGKKSLKLFLLLATPEEWRDAAAAGWYLKALRNRRPNAPGTELEKRLIERYGPLLGPRQLRCRPCLSLRYGQARPRRPLSV